MNLYIVDAFADKIFTGNPAAVCPVDSWPSDALMQQIAFENNLAETAFVVNEPEGYRIRWFTPLVEVDLCGHATLASAHVLFNHEHYVGNEISFNSRSGPLSVTRHDGLLSLNFPADTFEKMEPSETLLNCFSIRPGEIYKGNTDYMFVFETEQEIEHASPRFEVIETLDARGVIITAKGKEVDFVSRFFAPQCGIDEDPVTGSAHTTLTPYWSGRLGKTSLSARQLSTRGGDLHCQLINDRIIISGKAVTYLIGDIQLNN
jgi:PhzF family phenazine biosynthesis protein